MMRKRSLGMVATYLATVVAVGAAGNVGGASAEAVAGGTTPAGRVTGHGGMGVPAVQSGDVKVDPVIAAGGDHTCATNGRGGVFCWGSNMTGQLGRGVGLKKRTNVPVKVVALGDDNVSVTTGHDFSCALKRSGAVFCWGDNRFGQIGDGTTARRSKPVAVSRLGRRVVDVSAGSNHACAVKGDGSVWCWGYNWQGALGDGTTETRLRPVRVEGLRSRAVRVTAGSFHSCALLQNGTVSCWGSNSVGELGHDSFGGKKKPRTVRGMRNVTSVSAGWYFTCARQESGQVWCWGVNKQGQLGDGSTTYSWQPRPLKVPGEYKMDVLATLEFAGCAGMEHGRMKCWGLNSRGQLGDGTTADRSTPRNVAMLKGHFLSISNGSGHTCAINASDLAYCWGANHYGQLGDGTEESSTYPVPAILPG